MLVYVATTVSILAGLVTVFAFGLGVTRTARLRRREQLYREAIVTFGEDDQARIVVAELQRAALGEIIARQLTPLSRALLPWVFWLATIALTAQLGYAASDYFASSAKWSYYDFAIKVFGDPMAPILAAGVVVGFFPSIFQGYLLTITGRAEIARNFYEGKSLRPPLGLAELEAERQSRNLVHRRRDKNNKNEARGDFWPRVGQRMKKVGRGLLQLGFLEIPGLFAVALGLNIGIIYWLNHHKGKDQDKVLASLGSWPGWAALAFSALGASMVLVTIKVKAEMNEYSLPTLHPRSRLLVLPPITRRVAPDLTSITSD